MENVVEKNYLKDFYKQEEHNYNKILENINIDEDKNIQKIKNEINKLLKEVESKKIKLQEEIENIYTDRYKPIDKKIILHYSNERQYTDYFYDLLSGCEVDIEDYNNSNSNIYKVNNKRGYINVVVGYDFELASIIEKKYSYSISKNNDRITIKFLEEIVVPFMENKIIVYNAIDNTTDIVMNENKEYSNILSNIKDNYFINTMYNVDYKGNLSLEDLRLWNLTNKSFEIILKTSPIEIIDELIQSSFQETQPIYKLLHISQETYNEIIKRNIVKSAYKYINLINKSARIKKYYYSDEDMQVFDFGKSELDWLDYIDEINSYVEDLNFYNINYYCYNRYNIIGEIDNSKVLNNNQDDLLLLILTKFMGNEVLNANYSLGKFTNYVVNETINQGYNSVRDFIEDLNDYLEMCKQDNIKPTLYSSYLKQTHDITSRNHKIVVEKENEEKFIERYKDFKNYYGKNYMVIKPKNSNDLKQEGDNLNHCVASYIKRVIDGECLIYFLREQKDESLITFEVRNDRVVQIKGKHNRKPTKEELKAIQEFAKYRKMEVAV